jgi:hypothetical protein
MLVKNNLFEIGNFYIIKKILFLLLINQLQLLILVFFIY